MSRPPPDPIYILRGVGSSVAAVQFCTFNGDEQRLLSGDKKGIVSIWNLSTKRTEFTLNGHETKSILSIQYLKNNTLLSHGRDGYLHIWDVGRNEIQDSLRVSDVGFCKCEIISLQNPPHLRAINIAQGYARDFNGLQKTEDICIVIPSEEQSQVMLFSMQQIDIVCLKSKEIVKKLKPESSKSFGTCMCLKQAEGEKGRSLLVGYESGDIITWDLETSNMTSKLSAHKEPVMCIDFDSKSQRGISGSAEDKIIVFKLTAEKTLQLETSVKIKNSGISDVKIRGDGKLFATGGWDHKVRIFSWKSLKPLAILNYHTQSVDALAFSNCKEQLLAAGSKDGRISLWSLYKDS